MPVSDESWSAFAARFEVGSVVHGDVVSVVPFGAFIRIDEVDGFAPAREWPIPLEEGTVVPVRIAAIDAESRRFAVHPA
ncbi:S1 RNA-binding domain-containing protein [Asanoa sp. NPDC050611]|uniref:S1 RNA-binding domain-containing protein n=1 Tax=Asanoa sp. NPDC050611 TaxID=3157098 RepID=UPI00340C5FE5